ncbi:type I glyceraldehyde-3-phosphate dehydrogenase [Entomobacter blattae]|uniref:Glyceraldehyde-3-phosphate dehydrogenase n=1 Tax=Entomobacter blattae TaxID=2762277 RepID=A0A7H1NQ56_9PROT|nr:type I glyceraldehyde-3-phosphate dehydrogenase [Entomobacter blattae]QNT77916.1 Glyceraldehyde-3-phosphate dehydrogenase [Entomobacter blattae]
MAVKIAINGFGRIGRLVLRSIIESNRTDVVPVTINDLSDIKESAYLLKYDTMHGRFPGEVTIQGDSILIKANGRTYDPIKVTTEQDPTKLPYKGIDVAMECTGHFKKREKAALLLEAGARKVLISAPASDSDATIVYGVNHQTITKDMTIVSNASCTTNCLAPIAMVLEENYGIEAGYMLTAHSYTGDQRTVDTVHKDARRGRAAAQNIIPTSTGAARAVGLVLPQLKGKLDGAAVRVPTANVSFVSFDCILKKVPGSVEEINEYFKKATSSGPLKGVMAYNEDDTVSSDFNHYEFYSSVFDATQTSLVNGGKIVRVAGWYDNEWGFSTRMSDTAKVMGEF